MGVLGAEPKLWGPKRRGPEFTNYPGPFICDCREHFNDLIGLILHFDVCVENLKFKRSLHGA
jgi:hypothetical protein